MCFLQPANNVMTEIERRGMLTLESGARRQDVMSVLSLHVGGLDDKYFPATADTLISDQETQA